MLGRMGRAYGRMGAVGNKLFSISDLFAGGAYAGFDYTDLDVTKVWGPSGLKLLFKDLVGTAVSASADSINLGLDKSQGVTLGSELVPDPSFDAPASWTVNSPWSVAGGKATFTSDGSTTNYIKPTATVNLVAGACYRIVYTIADITSGTANFAIFNGNAGVNLFGSYRAITANGVYVNYVLPAADSNGIRLYAQGGTTAVPFSVTDISIVRVAGNHAIQATSGSRPTWQANSGKPRLRLDGVDDGFTGTLVPGPSMTMMAAIVAASGSSGTDHVMGAADAGPTARCQLGITDGVPVAGWGSHTVSTIISGSSTDIRNTNAVIGFRANASVEELWVLYANGTLTREYQGTPSGTATTAQALALGAHNGAGTLANFFQGDIGAALAVKQFAGENQFAAAMRNLATIAYG